MIGRCCRIYQVLPIHCSGHGADKIRCGPEDVKLLYGTYKRCRIMASGAGEKKPTDESIIDLLQEWDLKRSRFFSVSI